MDVVFRVAGGLADGHAVPAVLGMVATTPLHTWEGKELGFFLENISVVISYMVCIARW